MVFFFFKKGRPTLIKIKEKKNKHVDLPEADAPELF